MNSILKIPDFYLKFQKIKKIKKIPHLKKYQNIFYFYAYGQILKFLHVYFLKKKNAFLLCFKSIKMDIVIGLWLSIMIWLKFQKSPKNEFV